MGRRARPKENLDTELADLPSELRWREWMGRVEAVIFASPVPVTREVLARVVGRDCSIDLLIDDIRDELRGRPYELVSVAGGWQHRTRKNFAEAIRAAIGAGNDGKTLSQTEALILACIAYYQPINRSELSSFFGKEVSRDTIARLRGLEFIAAGPRSPQPGAPYTYVTTKAFLSHFGLETLRDLPDMDALEDAGLLSKDKMLAGEFPMADHLAGGDGRLLPPNLPDQKVLMTTIQEVGYRRARELRPLTTPGTVGEYRLKTAAGNGRSAESGETVKDFSCTIRPRILTQMMMKDLWLAVISSFLSYAPARPAIGKC